MYTKTIFIALLLLAASFKSNSVSNKNIVFNVNPVIAPVTQPETVPPVNWNLFTPTLADNISHNHNHNEDGKHHQFHFERFSRLRRGKKICCAIGKFIIFIMHICLLMQLSGLVHA